MFRKKKQEKGKENRRGEKKTCSFIVETAVQSKLTGPSDPVVEPCDSNAGKCFLYVCVKSA